MRVNACRFQGVQSVSTVLSAQRRRFLRTFSPGRVVTCWTIFFPSAPRNATDSRALLSEQTLAHAVGTPINLEEVFGAYGSTQWILRCAENLLKRTSRLI